MKMPDLIEFLPTGITLPRECSTTERRQRPPRTGSQNALGPSNGRDPCHKGTMGASNRSSVNARTAEADPRTGGPRRLVP
jgi:hypothetical protein